MDWSFRLSVSFPLNEILLHFAEGQIAAFYVKFVYILPPFCVIKVSFDS